MTNIAPYIELMPLRSAVYAMVFVCPSGILVKRLNTSIYLRQGGCVSVVVCLSVSNLAQKLPNGYARNFQGRLAMGQ